MNTYTIYSDNELIEKFCGKHDMKAFDEIYTRYIDDVYRFVYSRVMNTADTEDIVSDTFITLLSCLHAFNKSSKLKSFIIGISVNKMRHNIRDKAKRKEIGLNEDIWGEDIIEDYNEEKEEAAEEMVKEVFSHLPKNYTYILEHLYIQGEPIDKIAEDLGITRNNARVLHHRALKKAFEISHI